MHNKFSKRAVCLITIFIFFTNFILGNISVFAANRENLISNGGFESGTTSWLAASCDLLITGKDPIDGRAALKIINRLENYSTPMQWVNLQQGKTYSVSLWLKLQSGESDCRYAVEFYREDGTKEAVEMFSQKVGSEWTNIKGTFKVNFKDNFVKTKVMLLIDDLENIYCDNYILVEGESTDAIKANVTGKENIVKDVKKDSVQNKEIEFMPDNTIINLVSNPRFEKGLSGYSFYNCETSFENKGILGNQVLKVVPNGTIGGMSVKADLIYKKNYVLSIRYKGNALSVLDENKIAVFDYSEDWKTENFKFKYEQIKDVPCLKIESDGVFYIESLSIYEVTERIISQTNGENKSEMFDPGLILNSSFEEGMTSFVGIHCNVTDEDSHSGKKSIKVTDRQNTYDGPQQWIDCKAGTLYYASAWIKPISKDIDVRITIQGSGIIQMQNVKCKANQWTKVSGEFNTNSVTRLKMYFETVGTGSFYADDFQFIEAEKFKAMQSTSSKSSSINTTNPNNITFDEKSYYYNWDFRCSPGTGHILAGWQVEQKNENGSLIYSAKGIEDNGLTKLSFYADSPTISTLADKSLSIDADKYKYIRIKGENSINNASSRISWSTEESGALCNYDFTWDNSSKEMIIDLSDNEEWNGNISRIYFTPAMNIPKDQYGYTVLGNYFTLEDISVFSGELKKEESVSESITRADFVELLTEKLGLINNSTNEVPFYDVSNNAPWYKSVLAAYEAKIIRGNENNIFSPGTDITREEATIMAMRACEYFKKDTNWNSVENDFDDENDFYQGCSGYAKKAVELSFIDIESNRFNPKTNISITDASKMIDSVEAWISGIPEDNIFVSDKNVNTYDIVRINVNDINNGKYTNPYDYDEVQANCILTSADGEEIILPGFYEMFGDYQFDPRRTVKEFEQGAYWKFRFAPTNEGEWRYRIVLTTKEGNAELGSGTIVSADNGSKGFVRADEENPRFVYEDGTPYFGFGLNVGWPDNYSYSTYDDYVKKYADDNGANLMRVWFEHPKDSLESFDTGVGHFDNVFASQLDYLMNLTRQSDVKIIASLKTFHFLSTKNAMWQRSVYNSFTGGPLEDPSEVFSNAELIKSYKELLRFVIARYAAYDNLLVWEFWNEEEGITGWRNANVKNDIIKWHDEMLEFTKETDPYEHSVGTSGTSPAGEEILFGREQADYICWHNYNMPQPAMIVRADTEIKKEKYGNKPNIYEEFSIKQELGSVDKEGAITHEALWSSIAAGASATTPPWWWDTWMKTNGHWNIYKPIANFMEGFNWPDKNIKLENMKMTSKERGSFIIPAGYYEDNQYADIKEVPVKSEFTYDFNKEEVREVRDIIYESKINNNMVYTFNVDVPEATNMVVTIAGNAISTTAGGEVVVIDNGTEIYRGVVTTEEQLIKKHIIPISAGKHKLELKNGTSNKYHIAWIEFEKMAPLTVAEAAIGENNAVILVRDTNATYSNMLWNNYKPKEIEGATVELSGLKNGQYTLEWWNTYTGEKISVEDITYVEGNENKVVVPSFTKDIAAKLLKR